jgi:carbon monoxide dehydrogenase subunit G
MRFTMQRRVQAPPEKVWKLIGDFSMSPGNGVQVRVLEPGAKGGVGLVRDITIGKMVLRERIDEVVPGASFSYSITAGTPTKSYKGKGQIDKDGNGTVITWSGDIVPKVPFTGLVIKLVAAKSVAAYLDAVLSKLTP